MYRGVEPLSLLATLGLVRCGMKAVKKPAATPMRKSAWKREACLFAYMLLRRLAVQVAVQNRQCTILFCTDSLSCTGGIAEWAGTVQDRLSWRDGEDARRACCTLCWVPPRCACNRLNRSPGTSIE
eukprot:scaffold77932_cov71-Phaeocystis_antarctica.AAC.3